MAVSNGYQALHNYEKEGNFPVNGKIYENHKSNQQVGQVCYSSPNPTPISASIVTPISASLTNAPMRSASGGFSPVHEMQNELAAQMHPSFWGVAEPEDGIVQRLTQRVATFLSIQKTSRGATLHLIDRLAKLAPPLIAIIMAATAYLVTVIMPLMPVQALIWGGLVSSAGILLFKRNRAFLTGDACVAARPIYFRACHTANLLAFSVSFSAGLILFGERAFTAGIGFQVFGVTGLALFLGALMQLAHGRAILAMLGPLLASLVFLFANNGLPGHLFMITMCMFALLALGLGVLCVGILKHAQATYPRTTLQEKGANRARTEYRRKALPSLANNKPNSATRNQPKSFPIERSAQLA